MFKFVKWTGLPLKLRGRRGPWVFYHRLANAGRLQFGPVCLMWPLPWADGVKDQLGYARDNPSGVRAAMGWKQRL